MLPCNVTWRHGTVWYGMVVCGTLCYAVLCDAMLWNGMLCNGMEWNRMEWDGVTRSCIFIFREARAARRRQGGGGSFRLSRSVLRPRGLRARARARAPVLPHDESSKRGAARAVSW